MKLIKGKFYNDEGAVVPLEFGNKDQINLLEFANALKTDGVLWFTSDFTCLCGVKNFPTINKSFTCECGQKYKATLFGDEYPIIKFA